MTVIPIALTFFVALSVILEFFDKGNQSDSSRVLQKSDIQKQE